MTKPMIRIHNAQTNETIDREMNDEEFEQYQINQAEVQAKQAEQSVKEAARIAILDRLGITDEEAKLLLS
jgi:hypothetical protein